MAADAPQPSSRIPRNDHLGVLAFCLLAASTLDGCSLLVVDPKFGADAGADARVGMPRLDSGTPTVPDQNDSGPPTLDGTVGALLPRVVSISPSDAATDAEPDARITVVFSEAMDPTSTEAAFGVYQGETPVPGTVQVEGDTVTFTPEARLSLSRQYSVQVSDEAMSAARGQLQPGFESTFVVRDGLWEMGRQLAFRFGASASGLQVALTPSGDGIAVWMVSDSADPADPDSMLLWMPFAAGASSGEVGVVPVSATRSVELGIDEEGRATLVCVDETQATVALSYTASSGWSAPYALTTGRSGAERWISPSLSVNRDGHAVVTLVNSGIGGSSVATRIFDPTSSTWAPSEAVPGSATGTFLGSARSTLLADETVITVWRDVGGGLEGNRTWASGSGPRREIYSGTDAGGRIDAIVADSLGRAYVVGRESAIGGDVWAHRFDPLAGGWGGRARSLRRSVDQPAFDPSIDVDPTGNAFVLWAEREGDSKDILARRQMPGGDWSDLELVESMPGDASSPQVAVRAVDDAIAVWSQYSGGARSIFASTYDTSTGWRSATPLEDDALDGHGQPRLAYAENGVAVVLWIRQEPEGDSSVWGASLR